MTVEGHGLVYDWCTGEERCPGVLYTDEASGQEICVSPSVCTNVYKLHAYSYGDVKKCLKTAPVDENEFTTDNDVH